MHRTDAIQSAAPDTAVAIETSTLGLHTFEQYAPLIGAAASERIFSKAEALRTLHVVHISSTFYGAGSRRS
jgi:trehalose synthase